ncbi:single-stranded DNA-binding protein [Aspergillus puulaauensis]|uniref:SsDNA-binding protein, mitochondrial n=1 Tax=Aspergillus puulaauensis TaxID=1220207 RepID=A0A7R7XZR1_9EURO|nr:ssDNA-binding protein, mitochondrial [Aspergillus puulaauensis]BCS29823.1 ssDNA-binding protein, mitochondrial [Aspergillus puulaauensis]
MSAFSSSSMRSFLRAAPRAATPARTFTTSPARSIARMNITGRLGVNPEVATLPNGQEFVRYSVGTNGGSRDSQTSWFRISAFVSDAQREFLLQVPKGSLVAVDATATHSKYTAADGKEQYALRLTQRSFEYLSRPHGAKADAGHSE